VSKIKEVEMDKVIISFLIKKTRIIFKITHATNETTSAIKNLAILKAVNKSFIFLLYHKGMK